MHGSRHRPCLPGTLRSDGGSLGEALREAGRGSVQVGVLVGPLQEARVRISYTQVTSKDLFGVNIPVYESDGNCMRRILPEPVAA